MHGTTEPNSDVPLYVEDTNLNGYFSDVSNSILRRVGLPKVSYNYIVFKIG